MTSKRLPSKYNKLIGQFRGIDCNERCCTDLKPEIPIKDCTVALLNQIYKKYSKSYDSSKISMLENWHKIVGARFCKYCQPYQIINHNTLIIKATNPIVKQELFNFQHIILQNIQLLFRRADIKKIKIY